MKVINNISKLFNRRKELRNNATPQEITLWNKLKNSKIGFKFRRQHSIGGYIVDFYCPSKKLVIEIDGSQHLETDSTEYDNNRTKFLNALGIIVLRFYNNEIDNNTESVLLKIEEELTKSQSRTSS